MLGDKGVPAAPQHPGNPRSPQPRQQQRHAQPQHQQQRALQPHRPIGPGEELAKDHLLRRLRVHDHPQIAILQRGGDQIAQANRPRSHKHNAALEGLLHLIGAQRAREDFPRGNHAIRGGPCVVQPQGAIGGGGHLDSAHLDRDHLPRHPAPLAAAIAGFDEDRPRPLRHPQGIQRQRGQHLPVLHRQQRRAAHNAIAIARKADKAATRGGRPQRGQGLDGAGILGKRSRGWRAGNRHASLGFVRRAPGTI